MARGFFSPRTFFFSLQATNTERPLAAVSMILSWAQINPLSAEFHPIQSSLNIILQNYRRGAEASYLTQFLTFANIFFLCSLSRCLSVLCYFLTCLCPFFMTTSNTYPSLSLYSHFFHLSSCWWAPTQQ